MRKERLGIGGLLCHCHCHCFCDCHCFCFCDCFCHFYFLCRSHCRHCHLPHHHIQHTAPHNTPHLYRAPLLATTIHCSTHRGSLEHDPILVARGEWGGIV